MQPLRRSGTVGALWHCDTVSAWPERFTLVDDLSEFGWIQLDPWVEGPGSVVTSVVPKGFAAYVRVFHPASVRSGSDEPVRWSEVRGPPDARCIPSLNGSWSQARLPAQGGGSPTRESLLARCYFPSCPLSGRLPRRQIDAFLPSGTDWGFSTWVPLTRCCVVSIG